MDALSVKTRLENLRHTQIPQSIDYKTIQNAKINIIEWLYNNGNLRTEDELQTKLQSIQEEILMYEFAEERGYMYEAAKAKLKEMEILNE